MLVTDVVESRSTASDISLETQPHRSSPPLEEVAVDLCSMALVIIEMQLQVLLLAG